MKILILHRIPFRQIDYRGSLDHNTNEVTYVGVAERIADLPNDLRCRKIVRPGVGPTAEEVLALPDIGRDYDRVISLSEYEIMDAAKIRQAWGLPGKTPRQVELVRDKVLMKGRVADFGIRTPWNARVNDRSRLPEKGDSPKWLRRSILKPTDGAASVGVKFFATLREAVTYAEGEVAAGRMDESKFQYDEFIDGQLVHVDGLLAGGEVLKLGACKYIGTPLAFAEGQPLGSVQIEMSAALEVWTKSVLNALEIFDGCFHLEAFLTDEGPVFLEIGARHGGGNIPDVFQYRYGVHLPSDELALYTNTRRPSEIKARTGEEKTYFGFFIFPGHLYTPGHQCRIQGGEAWQKHSQMRDWQPMPEGTALTNKIIYNANMIPLAGNVSGDSPEQVSAILQEIINSIRIETYLPADVSLSPTLSERK